MSLRLDNPAPLLYNCSMDSDPNRLGSVGL